MQPTAPAAAAQEQRMARLAALAGRFEIRGDWVARLRQLEGYEIVLLCDDSGSMASLVRAGGVSGNNPYAPQRTRWDELREYTSIAVDIAGALVRSELAARRPPSPSRPLLMRCCSRWAPRAPCGKRRLPAAQRVGAAARVPALRLTPRAPRCPCRMRTGLISSSSTARPCTA